MATGKKSFLLYTDLIHMVEKLPNDKAGELFKLILDYVNDKNPSTNDMLLTIAFEPIKHQLKRDLIAWENERSGRSEAGKKGMASRWGKNITNDNSVINVITDDNKPYQSITNITDNVNVNVNVIVINKENEKIYLKNMYENDSIHLNFKKKFKTESQNTFNLALIYNLFQFLYQAKSDKKEFKDFNHIRNTFNLFPFAQIQHVEIDKYKKILSEL